MKSSPFTNTALSFLIYVFKSIFAAALDLTMREEIERSPIGHRVRNRLDP